MFSFSYLLTPETFQRVDFSRVAPHLARRDGLVIQEFAWRDLTFGPLQATLPLQQNLLRIQSFSLHALDGVWSGEFYLDLNPEGWRLGLLSRVSQVDLRPLLPTTLAGTEAAPINARVAVEFDFTRRLLEGRIDLTEVTRVQFLQLMDLIDPDQRDAQMATLRSALRIAQPEWVTAQMQDGMLELSVSLARLSAPLRVRGLPLSPIIERFAAELVALPQTLPMEVSR